MYLEQRDCVSQMMPMVVMARGGLCACVADRALTIALGQRLLASRAMTLRHPAGQSRSEEGRK